MKIGFDAKRIYHNRTGLGNYSRDLVRIMSEYHPNNSYLLYNPKEAKNNLFSHSSDNVIEKRPKSRFHKTFYNLWRQKSVCKDIMSDKIDVFHGLTGEIPIGIQKTGIPAVVTIHDLIFLRYPHFYSVFDRYIHKLKAQYAVNNADAVVAVSQQTKQDIIDFFGVEPGKIRVVYQGCQDVFKEVFPSSEVVATIKKYGLPQRYFLNVGTIEERKNILSVVAALKGREENLVIIGSETEYTQKVKAYIQVHGMEKRVFFPKGVSSRDLAIIYQGADVFLYPSLFEGFGIPIIEALNCGVPVITSRGGCFGEAGGPNSFYVDSSKVGEIRSAIDRIMGDIGLREKMITEGRSYAQRFNKANIANEFGAIYNQIIKKEPNLNS